MSLKIIGGDFGGRKLLTLPDLNTRPTANRTREALFNILAYEARDAYVLDLFAGSGALGLEALSRGAQQAVFVESDRKACEIITKNIALCKVEDQARLYHGKINSFQGQPQGFNLIFMDPPYARNLVSETLAHLAKAQIPAAGATIVAEHESGLALEFDENVFTLAQTRVYGKASLSFFKYL